MATEKPKPIPVLKGQLTIYDTLNKNKEKA